MEFQAGKTAEKCVCVCVCVCVYGRGKDPGKEGATKVVSTKICKQILLKVLIDC